mmetsp:Transcript_34393/g.63225  ORF Transcript_34393/g.63225 Transcript_34393/m.63225 type:complete len:270 (-) Transcript_34393:478-1287(-)
MPITASQLHRLSLRLTTTTTSWLGFTAATNYALPTTNTSTATTLDQLPVLNLLVIILPQLDLCIPNLIRHPVDVIWTYHKRIANLMQRTRKVLVRARNLLLYLRETWDWTGCTIKQRKIVRILPSTAVGVDGHPPSPSPGNFRIGTLTVATATALPALEYGHGFLPLLVPRTILSSVLSSTVAVTGAGVTARVALACPRGFVYGAVVYGRCAQGGGVVGVGGCFTISLRVIPVGTGVVIVGSRVIVVHGGCAGFIVLFWSFSYFFLDSG